MVTVSGTKMWTRRSMSYGFNKKVLRNIYVRLTNTSNIFRSNEKKVLLNFSKQNLTLGDTAAYIKRLSF